jgi:uncharacterized Zn-finger protein
MNNYTLDISREELIDCCLKELVLEWCQNNHPHIFAEIKEKLEIIYDEAHNNHFS